MWETLLESWKSLLEPLHDPVTLATPAFVIFLAVEWFAASTGSTLAEATRVRTELYPPGHMDVGDIRNVATSIEQGIRFKRLTRAPTSEELAGFIDVPWKPAAP